MIEAPLKPGDVVQLDPEKVRAPFGASFMIISEWKGWGAIGFTITPGHGRAYYRARTDEMAYIGRAEWLSDDIETDQTP